MCGGRLLAAELLCNMDQTASEHKLYSFINEWFVPVSKVCLTLGSSHRCCLFSYSSEHFTKCFIHWSPLIADLPINRQIGFFFGYVGSWNGCLLPVLPHAQLAAQSPGQMKWTYELHSCIQCIRKHLSYFRRNFWRKKWLKDTSNQMTTILQ